MRTPLAGQRNSFGDLKAFPLALGRPLLVLHLAESGAVAQEAAASLARLLDGV